MNAAVGHYPMSAFAMPSGLERAVISPDRQEVYLRPDQMWQADAGPGKPSLAEIALCCEHVRAPRSSERAAPSVSWQGEFRARKGTAPAYRSAVRIGHTWMWTA